MALEELLVVLSLAALAAAGNGTRCFECTDVPHPSDCNTVTECSPGQICFVDQYITTGGLALYKTGCESTLRCGQAGRRRKSVGDTSASDGRGSLSRRADIITCTSCCSDNFCNNEGCGTKALKPPQRGPQCYACDFESDPEMCRTVKTCDLGEVCMLTELKDHSPDGKPLYKTQCQTQLLCDALTMVGRNKRYNFCHVCCNSDFCNDECDPLQTPVPTSPPTTETSATASVTMTSSGTTTTPVTVTTRDTQTTRASTAATTVTMKTTLKTLASTRPTLGITSTHQTSTANHHQNNHALRCLGHPGYQYDPHSNLCYKFHYNYLNWDDANHFCKSEGGTLAIIDTKAKWDYLKPIIEHDRHFGPYWLYIGAKDVNQTRTFVWPNGEGVVFNNWGQGQPDGYLWNDQCVAILPDEGRPWDDVGCYFSYPFVCTIDGNELEEKENMDGEERRRI